VALRLGPLRIPWPWRGSRDPSTRPRDPYWDFFINTPAADLANSVPEMIRNAPEGNVSFVPELGTHAGPSADELHTFIISPAGAGLPEPITHPIQLYPHFIRYQEAA